MRKTAAFAGVHSRHTRVVHHGGGAHQDTQGLLDPRLVADLLRHGDAAAIGQAVVRAAGIAAAMDRSARAGGAR